MRNTEVYDDLVSAVRDQANQADHSDALRLGEQYNLGFTPYVELWIEQWVRETYLESP